jgi:hypothetical protein
LNCYNNKKGIVILTVFFIYSTSIFSQNQTLLKGSVVSQAEDQVELYTFILLSSVDSLIVAMDMFFDTEFQFANLKPQAYILRLQGIQYQPFDTLITVVSGENVLLAPIMLIPRALDEVVVKASRPVISHKNGNLTLDVGNSYLKNESRMDNILGRLPGVIVDNGAISMFGKEHLLIYINDKEIRSQDQIKSLQPIDIDKIEIIRNVGSEYNAMIDAVIKIWTKKNREKNIFISFNNNLSVNQYLSNDVNLSLYINHNKKISQYFTLYNSISKGIQDDKSYTYTFLNTYENLNFRNISIVNQFNRNNLFYSLNYSINENKEFGVQYSGIFNEWNSASLGMQQIFHDEILNKTINFNNKDIIRTNFHDINLNYKQQINNTDELSVIADYAIQSKNVTNDVSESSVDNEYTNNIFNASSGDYSVISINPEYKAIRKKITYNWGIKYSSVFSNSIIEYYPSMNVEHYKLSEHLGGLYMTLDAKLSFVDIKSGIRSEYVISNIKSDNESGDLNRNYFNLFPYLSISKDINDCSFVLYYRRQILRPSFADINPEYIYRDSLTYVAGNPHLKPTLIDNFNMNVNYSKFNILIGYNIYKDYIFMENISDSSNQNITISTYGNMKNRYNRLTIGISYSFNNPILTNEASLNYSKPYMNIPFNNGIIRFHKPIYLFKTSGNINMSKNTTVDYSYLYRSHGHSQNIEWKSYSNLSVALTQYAMNKKMMLSLSIEDIFNKRKSNRWTSYSNNISYTMDSWPSGTREVVFTIRYI